VFASAANRAEHRIRGVHETGSAAGIEGAVALLFTAEGALGLVSGDDTEAPGEAAAPGIARVRAADATPEPGAAREPAPRFPFAPVLEPALAILAALARGADATRIEIHEPHRTTAFRWSRP